MTKRSHFWLEVYVYFHFIELGLRMYMFSFRRWIIGNVCRVNNFAPKSVALGPIPPAELSWGNADYTNCQWDMISTYPCTAVFMLVLEFGTEVIPRHCLISMPAIRGRRIREHSSLERTAITFHFLTNKHNTAPPSHNFPQPIHKLTQINTFSNLQQMALLL